MSEQRSAEPAANDPSGDDPRVAAYGRGVAADVVVAISAEFPLVAVTTRLYETGVWLARVEFAPPREDSVPVWLVVNRDKTFVVAAGETYRWDEEFIPELREQQVGVIVAEIRDLALHGLLAVRTNRLFGVYSTTVVGTPDDEFVATALARPLAKELERFTGWN
ncbi:MAG TPA: hypothetical protein VGM94_16575 [Galbitalea sp.]|jgi:hypothetical protein